MNPSPISPTRLFGIADGQSEGGRPPIRQQAVGRPHVNVGLLTVPLITVINIYSDSKAFSIINDMHVNGGG